MLKRILSLVCCLSLTVGLFTYRPPEAKALVTEASLATSVLWSFMQSAGITFNGTGMNSSSWAEAIEPYLRDFTEWKDSAAKSFWHWLGYDGASEFIKALSWSQLTHPTTMPFPSVTIPPAAAKKMGEFTLWFAKKVGLVSGGGSVHVAGDDFVSAALSTAARLRAAKLAEDPDNGFWAGVDKAPYYFCYKYVGSTYSKGYCILYGVAPITLERHDSGFSAGGKYYDPGYYLYKDGSTVGFSALQFSSLTATTYSGGATIGGLYYRLCSLDTIGDYVLSSKDAPVCSAAQPGTLSPTFDDNGEKSTVVAYPNINGDLTSINDLLQKILDKLAANDLSSSASLEGEAAPDVPATDIGWKGTIEKIYQGIIDLPGRIAEAIKDLFIPHEGYAAEFVSGLTGAYQGRFGLLTYPFSVLGDFVGTVATLDEQEPILRWNDVKWQDHVVIAKGEYNLKSAISGTEMQTVYQVYRVVASAALIVGFLHLCIRKLREVQSH